MGGAMEAEERPADVLGHHPHLDLNPLPGGIDRLHQKLPGSAGCHEHAAGHDLRGPRVRRLLEASRHDPREQEHVVADVEHAGRHPGQVGGRLAARERLEHEPGDLDGFALGLIHPGPHRGDVHAPLGAGRRHDSFDDHPQASEGEGQPA